METKTEKLDAVPEASPLARFSAELRTLLDDAEPASEGAVPPEPHRVLTRFREAARHDPRSIDVACVEPLLTFLGPREAEYELRKVAQLLMTEGHPEHAAALLEAVLEAAPERFPHTLTQLGDAETLAGHWDEARRHLTEAFKIFSERGMTRARLAVARRLVPLSHDRCASLRLLACIRLERGDVHEALHAISPVLVEHPGDPVALELLARALRMLGRDHTANQVLRLMEDEVRTEGRTDALGALVDAVQPSETARLPIFTHATV